MTQADHVLLDNLARLLTGAADAAASVRREVEVLLRSQAERLVADMDLAPREALDAMTDMAAATRTAAEELRRRVDGLEARLEALERQARELQASDPRTPTA